MQETINTIILSIIEGITEFLPISSTGHLLLAAHFLNDHRSEFFNIGIQAGAVLAVVLIYWRKLLNLIIHWRKPEQFHENLTLATAFIITAILGLTVKKFGFELTENPIPVAWAVFLGAIAIFWAEHRLKKNTSPPTTDPDSPLTITFKIAVLIGAAQVLAGVFPGTSRSAATIIAAMLLGISRMKATEFSFLLGIPTMFAATFYSLYDEIKENGSLPTHELEQFTIGFIVSTIVAFLAVKWLLNFLRSNTFTPFAWYRLILGLGLLLWFYLNPTE